MTLKKIYSSTPSSSFNSVDDTFNQPCSCWTVGPIKHWRKAQISTTKSVTRSNVNLPMSVPGGYGSTIECPNNETNVRINLVQEVMVDSNAKNCSTEEDAKTRLRNIGAKIKDTSENPYSTTTSEYLQRRKRDYTYNDVSNNDCASTSEYKSKSIVKLNNAKFHVQGAVSNGSRLERLKMDALLSTCGSRKGPCQIYYHDTNTLPINVNQAKPECYRRQGVKPNGNLACN
jgi:hypothetical protein